MKALRVSQPVLFGLILIVLIGLVDACAHSQPQGGTVAYTETVTTTHVTHTAPALPDADAMQRVVSEGGSLAHQMPISFHQLLISLQQLIESLGQVRGVLRVRPAAARSSNRPRRPSAQVHGSSRRRG